ncbi:uncharacterized protein LOC116255669 [Nymphaea colorata]|nr:uncharacterized protein LOC116255669 [Nymphaea colorata]
MDYDFHKNGPPYDAYRATATGGYAAQSFYPRIGQHNDPLIGRAPPTPIPAPSTTPSGLGIRVAIKPEYRIAPPPALSPQMAQIPRSKFQFDFDFERKILAEAEKDSQNWSSIILENGPPSRTTETSSLDSSIPQDPLASKFVALGLSPEAVTLAVKTYGDNPTKVREFVLSYNRLREMGFAANTVAEVLAKYDNDMEKAVAHFLNI